MFLRDLLATAIVMALAMPSGWSQGWERTYGQAQTDALNDVLPTPDGGYLAVGSAQDPTGIDRNLLLLKTDADGNQEWSQSVGSNMAWEYGKSICAVPGGYVVGGTSIFDGISFGYAVKLGPFGQVEWSLLSSQDSVQGRQLVPLADGGYALVGAKQVRDMAGNGSNLELFLMKITADGQEAWWHSYGGPSLDDGFGVVETPDGGLLAAGITSSQGAGDYDVLLLRTDASGDSLWAKTQGTEGAETAFAISPTSDGNYVVTGQREAIASGNRNAHLLKIDPLGNGIWWRTFGLPGLESANAVQEVLPSGEFILTGEVFPSNSTERQLLLINTQADGNLLWQKNFGGIFGESGQAVKPAPNQGFIIAGSTHSFGAGASDGYLVRTDASGVSLSGFIHGNVHSNTNPSCIPDNFGQNVPGYLIEIAGATTTYYGTTDSGGNYFVPVEEGNYNVRLLNPSPLWQSCEDSVDIAVGGSFDSVLVNFAIYGISDCPLLEVDLTTLGLRRCFQNSYTVGYRNLGPAAADPALVEVSFDPALVVDSTSIPWLSHAGNHYLFDVGALPSFASGSFRAYVTLDCDSTVLGQTHCSEAHIFPDSLCLAPDPGWDGASVQVDATCTGDSILFTVENVGDADMSAPLNLIVIEDVLIGFQTSFQLDSHEKFTYAVLSDGTTFRLEADQSPGHPGNSRPSVSVEGCGDGPFSTGFVVQYPLNDADLSVDADCRENTGSFDPNDKQGFPTGYGPVHFIERGTDLEYLIRFQNTGTDTAFTVVVRDTLSPLLDPASVEVGAASHPLRYELYGNGILKLVFEQIMLPDSNTNEPLSHGFVKFRIKQRPTNPLGLVIQNRAGIYFDYNAPILTNTTFHTLGEDFILVDPALAASPGGMPLPKVEVYPNPFVEEAIFELKNVQAQGFAFRLFDRSGREVRLAGLENNHYKFRREGLPSGIYFFRIEDQGGALVASGSVVLR